MSPVIFSCVICEYPIYGYAMSAIKSWLKEFCASRVSQVCDNDSVLIQSVYSSPEETFISDVDQYDDLNDDMWIVLSDFAMQWDDYDYLFQASDELSVMQQCSENDWHDFVLHDACWRLL